MRARVQGVDFKTVFLVGDLREFYHNSLDSVYIYLKINKQQYGLTVNAFSAENRTMSLVYELPKL